MRTYLRNALGAGFIVATAAAAQSAFDDGAHDSSIHVTHLEATARFSVEELAALGTVEIEAVTPWTDGVVRFRGPTLETLARRMGVASGTIVIEAVNDYRIEEPLAPLLEDGAVLAVEMNGFALPMNSYGPVWLTFPSAADRRLARSEGMYRWIWQIDRIEFLPDAPPNDAER